jgi:hypothetical protein
MRRALVAGVVASVGIGGAVWWTQRSAPAGPEATVRPAHVTRLIIGSDHRYPEGYRASARHDTFRLVRVRPSSHNCTATSTPGTSTLVCVFR